MPEQHVRVRPRVVATALPTEPVQPDQESRANAVVRDGSVFSCRYSVVRPSLIQLSRNSLVAAGSSQVACVQAPGPESHVVSYSCVSKYGSLLDVKFSVRNVLAQESMLMDRQRAAGRILVPDEVRTSSSAVLMRSRLALLTTPSA